MNLRTTTLSPNPQRPPKPFPAASGDHLKQLTHLKTHLRFQAQTEFQQAKLSWNTTITKSQSYRHITTHLHHKINTKETNFHQTGTLNSPEGQAHLKDFATRLARGERLSPADGHKLPWNLRNRAIRSHHPLIPSDRFIQEFNSDHPGVLRPKEEFFPPHIREQRRQRLRLKQLLRRQGVSPRRHRHYLIAEAYFCHRCRRLHTLTDTTGPTYPECGHLISRDDLIDVAVKPDSPYAQHLHPNSETTTAKGPPSQ